MQNVTKEFWEYRKKLYKFYPTVHKRFVLESLTLRYLSFVCLYLPTKK